MAEEAKSTSMSAQEDYRCGYVALAGPPNVGKSALLNALVGEHLSIVSAKAQTTRERVSGLLTTSRYQIIFIDAPGLFEPRCALQEAMRWAALKAIEDADVVAFVCDATRPGTLPDETLVRAAQARSLPVVVGINKIDRVGGTTVAPRLKAAQKLGCPAIALSALSGEGLDEFLQHIIPRIPLSPPLFPPDDGAVQPVRFFVEEFVRETCMEIFRDEIPYSVAARVEDFHEDREPLYIRVTIHVERESQKPIVIGHGGSAIKRVGEISRQKIERLLGQHVYLELRVKVMRDWSRHRGRLRQLGFRLPPEPSCGQKRS